MHQDNLIELILADNVAFLLSVQNLWIFFRNKIDPNKNSIKFTLEQIWRKMTVKLANNSTYVTAISGIIWNSIVTSYIFGAIYRFVRVFFLSIRFHRLLCVSLGVFNHSLGSQRTLYEWFFCDLFHSFVLFLFCFVLFWIEIFRFIAKKKMFYDLFKRLFRNSRLYPSLWHSWCGAFRLSFNPWSNSCFYISCSRQMFRVSASFLQSNREKMEDISPNSFRDNRNNRVVFWLAKNWNSKNTKKLRISRVGAEKGAMFNWRFSAKWQDNSRNRPNKFILFLLTQICSAFPRFLQPTSKQWNDSLEWRRSRNWFWNIPRRLKFISKKKKRSNKPQLSLIA